MFFSELLLQKVCLYVSPIPVTNRLDNPKQHSLEDHVCLQPCLLVMCGKLLSKGTGVAVLPKPDRTRRSFCALGVSRVSGLPPFSSACRYRKACLADGFT